MDQNFQTSFIPKKPLAQERVVHSRPIGFFTVFSIFIFFSIALASGALYFYKGALATQLSKKDSDLKLARNRFEPAKIAQLQELDKRLDAATVVLDKHVAVSPIFEVLQKYTLKSVRYTTFAYTMDALTGKVNVKINGQALGYKSIALQGDLFSQHKREIIDPIFSNLSLDDKGNVSFDLNFLVDQSFINYKQLVNNGAPGMGSIVPTNQ